VNSAKYHILKSAFVVLLAKESVILARWLMGITLAIAAKCPDDSHAQ